MPTLNQYASRIAGIIGRQADHALLERVKDAFKDIFATRIRQSISQNGIDDLLIVSCVLPIVIDTTLVIKGFKIYKTSSKVPIPIRFKNDSPFTFVGLEDGISFSNRTLFEVRLSSCDARGFLKYYTYENGIIKLFVKTGYEALELLFTNFDKLYVKTIFERPEEVLAVIYNCDENDVELPFPSDMLESIIQELLKTEFGYVASEVEIKT